MVNHLAINGVQVLAGGVFQKAVAAFDRGGAVVEAAAFADGGRRQGRRNGRIQRAGVVLVDELAGCGGALVGFRGDTLASRRVVSGIRGARIAASSCCVVPRTVTLKLPGIGIDI